VHSESASRFNERALSLEGCLLSDPLIAANERSQIVAVFQDDLFPGDHGEA